MPVERDEEWARALLCDLYPGLLQDFEREGSSEELERIMNEVRAGGSALAALDELGLDPQLIGHRANGSVGTSQLWNPVRLNSTFSCPHITNRCSLTARRDVQGGWPMCYLDKDNPTGRRMKPKTNSAGS